MEYSETPEFREAEEHRERDENFAYEEHHRARMFVAERPDPEHDGDPYWYDE